MSVRPSPRALLPGIPESNLREPREAAKGLRNRLWSEATRAAPIGNHRLFRLRDASSTAVVLGLLADLECAQGTHSNGLATVRSVSRGTWPGTVFGATDGKDRRFPHIHSAEEISEKKF